MYVMSIEDQQGNRVHIAYGNSHEQRLKFDVESALKQVHLSSRLHGKAVNYTSHATKA